jgi:hypothetical protein
MDDDPPGSGGPEPAEEPLNVLESYLDDLEKAHTHAQKALEALYSPSGPKRSILYRIALGRAQSLLIGLYVQEQQRRHHSGTDR